MRSPFARAVDNVVLALSIIAAGFVISRQFIRSNLVCLGISVAAAFVALYFVIARQNKRLDKLMVEKSELKKIEATNYALRKMTDEQRQNFWLKLFETMKPTTSGQFVIAENVAILDRLNVDQIDKADVFFASQPQQGCDKTIVLCNGASPEAVKLAQSLGVSIFFPLETFALMKKFSLMPTTFEAEKKVRRHIFSGTFVRKRAKDFIKLGLLLYFLSLFIPFSKYYVIVASVCMVLGLICLFFGKKEEAASPLPLLD